MAYSAHAKQLRRCTALRKDGKPCQAWALWNGDGRCAAHTYTTRGPGNGGPWEGMRTQAPPCTCAAYQWPHRPGAGLCQWPDPPRQQCTTPAGTHSWMKPYRLRAALWAGSTLSTAGIRSLRRIVWK